MAFELVIKDFGGLLGGRGRGGAQAEGGGMNLESLCSSDHPSWNELPVVFQELTKPRKKVNQNFFLEYSPQSGLQLSNLIHFIHHTQFSAEIPVVFHPLKKACQNAGK